MISELTTGSVKNSDVVAAAVVVVLHELAINTALLLLFPQGDEEEALLFPQEEAPAFPHAEALPGALARTTAKRVASLGMP